jgi:arabinogalactan endo-1,4-beta-galactosidase
MPGGCDASAGATAPYAAPDGVNRALGQMSGDQLVRMDETARINWLRTNLWPAEAALLKAVADGIRSVDAQARFSTHVSGVASTQPRVAAAFFTAMKDGGFLVDEAGASYYPTSSPFPTDRVQAFKDTVAAVHAAIDRPTFIAEFGFPNRTMTRPFAWNDAPQGYALTPEGQAAFLRDLVAWSRQSGLVTGIRPWAPELVVPGWAPMALFTRQGSSVVTASQALDVFVSMKK